MENNVWESIYSAGSHLNRYPWDCVVTFLYRHAGAIGKKLSDLRVLEVGCGSGGNLWFAAREGASVAGTDCSPTAIAHADERFKAEGLTGEFYCEFLPDMPAFEPASFDCVIDRGCFAACPPAVIAGSLAALAGFTKPSGKLLSTFYGTKHTSCLSGDLQDNGMTDNIKGGSLAGVGPITFVDREGIDKLYGPHWEILELHSILKKEVSQSTPTIHDEWHLIASPRRPA